MTGPQNRKTVFLDRDGVINVEGGKHVTHSDDLHLLPGAVEAISALSQAGWTIVIYTNQSGVGRGYMTQEALDEIHERIHCEVVRHGGRLTAIYACPHLPDAGCACRKPKPGLLHQAAREHNLDLAAAFAVGDSPRDVGAGKAAGCRTVLVLSGHTSEYPSAAFADLHPDYVFSDLAAFAKWLLDQPT